MGQPLGQHFLKNLKAVEAALAALNLQKGDFVVEIGPGKGVLTQPLADKIKDLSGKLIAIEKDLALVDNLLKSRSGAEIIEGDALKILENPKFLAKLPKNWKIIGNIPYYITGHLLRILGEIDNPPQMAVLMVQKEVAERVTARPPKMNLLAAATQIWADISIIFRLKPGDFDPPPEVESAIIELATKYEYAKEELNNYYKLIHAAFKQPRKTLLNNLAERYGLEKAAILPILEKVGFGEKTRAQELSVEQLLQLSNNF